MKKVKELIPSFKRRLIHNEQDEEIKSWDAEFIIKSSSKDALSLRENCTLAAGQTTLAAETLRLGTCSLGYINTFFNIFRSVSKVLKIPVKHCVGYTLAIG